LETSADSPAGVVPVLFYVLALLICTLVVVGALTT
jgi:hypothetical protein